MINKENIKNKGVILIICLLLFCGYGNVAHAQEVITNKDTVVSYRSSVSGNPDYPINPDSYDRTNGKKIDNYFPNTGAKDSRLYLLLGIVFASFLIFKLLVFDKKKNKKQHI